MDRQRITFTVSIDLDPVPGEGHTAESMQKVIQSVLDLSVGHYGPKVEQPALPNLYRTFAGNPIPYLP